MSSFRHEVRKLSRYLGRRALVQADREWILEKTDLVHLISKRRNLMNYLELCTSTTGQYYTNVMQWRFNSSHRLMYNCPNNFDDGFAIDFRTDDFDIGPIVTKLRAASNLIDICLVDGFHTYDCAIRDLTCAFDLLEDGGVLVVHDCLPPSETFVSSTWIPGDWAGVSYKAYLDFVLTREDLDYCTVATDWGCGVIIKNRAFDFMAGASSTVRKSKLAQDWFSIHNNEKDVFQFFMQNHKQLLLLISAKTFVRGIGRRPFDMFAAGSVAVVRAVRDILGLRGRLA
jgi:hypothetical protein